MTYKLFDGGGENESVKVYRCQEVCRRELGLTPASVNLFSNNSSKIKQRKPWIYGVIDVIQTDGCHQAVNGYVIVLGYGCIVYQHSYVSVPRGTDTYAC